MSAVTHTLHRFVAEYGRAFLLAVLVHIVILAVLLTTKFSPPRQLPVAEPIISFLYQPPAPRPAVVIPQAPDAEATPDPDKAPPEAPPDVSTIQQTAVPERLTSAEMDSVQEPLPAAPATAKSSESLVRRALSRVAEPDLAAIEQAANTSYQQFLQKQQQPRLTVDKKHWPVNQDPAQQVVAQLDDGKHIVRIRKGVCVIGDPTLGGFEGLMAARRVPCGDEEATSAMLKQALDKHIKR